jgi:hypothetical protein
MTGSAPQQHHLSRMKLLDSMISKKVSQRISLVSRSVFTYFAVVGTRTRPGNQFVFDEADTLQTRNAPVSELMEWENEGGAFGKELPLHLLSGMRDDQGYLTWIDDIEKRLQTHA